MHLPEIHPKYVAGDPSDALLNTSFRIKTPRPDMSLLRDSAATGDPNRAFSRTLDTSKSTTSKKFALRPRHLRQSLFLLFLGLFLRFPSFPPLLEPVADCVLELLPPRPIKLVTQLPEVVHLSPTISTPLTARHINHKISISFAIVDLLDVFAASAFGKAIDLALRYKCSMRPYPGLVDVKMLHSILLLVLPLHVFLLVANRIPPDIQKPIRPCTPVDEE